MKKIFESIFIPLLIVAIFIGISFMLHLSKSSNRVIKVGTTGDYPPLSYFNPTTRQFDGFDIDLIKLIGKQYDWKIHFVKTSWSTLSKDLLENKFIIAVGGITNTTLRRRDFLVTSPILSDGKVPLIKCE